MDNSQDLNWEMDFTIAGLDGTTEAAPNAESHPPPPWAAPRSPNMDVVSRMYRRRDEGERVSDSEDSDDVKMSMATILPRRKKPQAGPASSAPAAKAAPWPPNISPFMPYDIGKGEMAPKDVEFCPFYIIEQYSWRFAGSDPEDKVREYFKTNVFAPGNAWDMYRLHDPYGRRDPLILVPTVQFQAFLSTANIILGTSLDFSKGKQAEKVRLTFGDFGSPRPKFVARVIDEETYKALKSTFGAPPDDLDQVDVNNRQIYMDKVDDLYKFKNVHRKKDPEVRRLERIQKQKGWGAVVKRAQRYLGLRTRLAYTDAGTSRNAWTVKKTPPFRMESNVRFVCVDVEAYERNHEIVTEVGIATLDTEDLAGVAPGDRARKWFQFIDAHHLRIKEVSYMVNREFVRGCPDNFNFGKTEMVSQDDVAKRVADIIGDAASTIRSPVVMVGHDLGVDLKYLNSIGYSVWKLAEFLDEIDTKVMSQRIQFLPQGRGLQAVCDQLEIPGRYFHNAGNDAVYTLRAMLAMAVIHKQGGLKFQAASQSPHDMPKEDEWSDGDLYDGGEAVISPAPPETVPTKPLNGTANVWDSQRW